MFRVWGHRCAKARRSSCCQGLKRGWTSSVYPPSERHCGICSHDPLGGGMCTSSRPKHTRVRGASSLWSFSDLLLSDILFSSGLQNFAVNIHENDQHTTKKQQSTKSSLESYTSTLSAGVGICYADLVWRFQEPRCLAMSETLPMSTKTLRIFQETTRQQSNLSMCDTHWNEDSFDRVWRGAGLMKSVKVSAHAAKREKQRCKSL